jgi:hypothetical protein
VLRFVTAWGAVALLLFAPTAAAKFRITLALSTQKPRVGQAVTLVLRTDKDLEPTQNLRLQALSPQLRWVVDVQLVRAAPNAWRGVFRFKSKGTWRLIVPNWGAPGSASPIPLDRRVTVLPKRR